MPQTFKVGEAPWEKNQQAASPSSFKAGEAPWEAPSEEDIIQEMHPSIDSESRAVVKNYSTNVDSSIAYLRKKHPGLQFQWSGDQILAKKPDEKQWRTLDPDTSAYTFSKEGLKELGRDLLDIKFDVGAGTVEGLATAGAGIAAGLASGGTAAIPAAIAAGAGTAAGMEGARQARGRALGIPQEYSMEDILLSGGLGAASPVLMGTGAGVKQVAKAGLKKGLSEEVIEKAAKGQKGAIGRFYDATAGAVGPWLGEKVSQENKEVIKTAAKNLKLLKEADASPQVRTGLLQETSGKVKAGLKQETAKVGDELNSLRSMIDNPQGGMTGELAIPGQIPKAEPSIPTKDFLAPFQDLVENLRSTMTGTEGEKRDLGKLAKILQDEFMVDGKLPEMMTAAQVDAKRKRFKKLAEQYGLKYGKSGQTVSAMEGATPLDASIASAFESSRERMNDAIIGKLEEIAPGAGKEYQDLMGYYSELKGLQKENLSKFKSSRSTSQTFTRALKDDTEAANLQALKEVTGVDVEKAALLDESLKRFSKPSSEIRSVGGTTSTSKSIPLTAAGAMAGIYAGRGEGDRFLYGLGGGLIGSKLGSPAAMRTYMQMNEAARRGLTSLPGFGPATRLSPWMNMIQNRPETQKYQSYPGE